MKRFFSLLILLGYLHGAPTVTGLNPTVGPRSGGTIVTITGTGFTGATAVNFGTTPASSFIVDSDTSITATTAAHAPQVVPVTVTTPSGSFITTSHSQLFIYQGDIFGYVTNSDTNTVTVIDTVTNAIITSIGVGIFPSFDAVTPDGTKVYVTNVFDDTVSVSVIDTATNMVISKITTENLPLDVSVTPDGTKVFVANELSNTVSVIDTFNDMVIKTIKVGRSPNAICIRPDGMRAYVSNVNDRSVSVIDVATLSVIATIQVGIGPCAVCITPDEKKLFVNNFSSGTVSVIDTATNEIIENVTVGSGPLSMAITPDGTEVYVANALSGTVSVIDTTTNMVFAEISIVGNLRGIVITPDGSECYVDEDTTNTVTVINTDTHAIIANFPVPAGAGALFVTPDGTKVFELSQTAIAVRNRVTDTNSVIATAPNYFMAIAPDQAPLAYFTQSAFGFSVTFNASSSVSPTGDIALYSWDFGDGTTLDTSNPITTHVYATSGIYTISLTVTNSAGTSTDQFFDFSSNPLQNQAVFVHSITVLRNGGPTARFSRMITVGLNFRGCQVANRSLTYTELVNVLTWQAQFSAGIIGYKIFRDAGLTDFVAFIPASGPLRFEDHNRCKNRVYTYYLVAISSDGGTSLVGSVTVCPIKF